MRDDDEALAVANDTEFGLSAGICTRSLEAATHFEPHADPPCDEDPARVTAPCPATL